MRLYVLLCAVGLLVDAIYGVLDVRSSAPSVAVLIGLLSGEQVRKKMAGWEFFLPTTTKSIAHEQSETGAKPSNLI